VRPSLLAALAVALQGDVRPAAAQQCELAGLPPFAGHAFPLQPELGDIALTRSFPSLGLFARQLVQLASEPILGHPDPTGIERLYLLELTGRVLVIESRPDVSDADVETFLDLRSALAPVEGEDGLLGFAFDPDFWSNGYFYVMYSAPASSCLDSSPEILLCSRVERYEASGYPPAVSGGGNPVTVLEIPKRNQNHNGGGLQFGPDGMLYVGVGDGGLASLRTSQDLQNLEGSLLRIDPRSLPDLVPPDNPFVSLPGARGEIFHFGLRNPWRFSFDRATGDLWIGDVGAGSFEEIDYLPAGTPGGVDFGWPDCEGNVPYKSNPCDPSDPDRVFPVLQYDHGSSGGRSVTGGYVYRGSRAPSLYGSYVYADWVSTRVWAWDRTSSGPLEIGTVSQPSSFGEDRSGELYLVTMRGGIHHFEETAPGSGGGPPPASLSETGLFQDVANLVPAPGLLEYEVNSPLWSDRATKRRWLALPAGGTIGTDPTGAWLYPVGTAFVKHFELEVAPGVFRRLETRVLLLQQTGWAGYTYRWNAAETDADLLPGALLEVFDVALPGLPATQTWSYPGPTDCIVCHSEAGGRVLGARTRQLNRAFDYAAYGGAVANQLEAWSCAGLLAPAIPDASAHSAWVDVEDTTATPDERVRSYLASNCEFCHQPVGTAPGSIDFRYDTPLDDTNLVGVPPQDHDFGLASPARIDPGDHANSILWQRLETADPALHMAAGTRLRHAAANQIVAEWIDQELIDPDGDGYRSFEDNCPLAANGALTGPDDQGDQDGDGVGNVCECSYAAAGPLVADADFNRNGVVSGGDYSIWADHYQSAVSSFDEGDANCDGFVDDLDLAIWEAHYEPSELAPPLASRGLAPALGPAVGGGIGVMAACLVWLGRRPRQTSAE
jgi:uncharacterized repeat protein (TIGR03806 family)